MNCDICNQKIAQKVDGSDHHLQPNPLGGPRCAGCWIAASELDLFLLRARDRTVMGDWGAGWLRHIVENPEKYRGMADKRIRTRSRFDYLLVTLFAVVCGGWLVGSHNWEGFAWCAFVGLVSAIKSGRQ